MRAIRQVQGGHEGVYFVAVHIMPYLSTSTPPGSTASPRMPTASATWRRPSIASGFELPYPALIPRHREAYATAQAEAHEQGLDYIPVAWVGWDDYGRSPEGSVRTTETRPARFAECSRVARLTSRTSPALRSSKPGTNGAKVATSNLRQRKVSANSVPSATSSPIVAAPTQYRSRRPRKCQVSRPTPSGPTCIPSTANATRRKLGLPENGLDLELRIRRSQPLPAATSRGDGRRTRGGSRNRRERRRGPRLPLARRCCSFAAERFDAHRDHHEVENGHAGIDLLDRRKDRRSGRQSIASPFPSQSGDEFQTYRSTWPRARSGKERSINSESIPTNAPGRIEIERVRTIRADRP